MSSLPKIKQSETTEASKDQSLFPVIKVEYMERTGDVTVCENYGFHSNPPIGTPCLMFTVNGDEGNRYVIPLSALVRTKGLKENELEIGNMVAKSLIRFLENSDIRVDSQYNIFINAPNNVEVDAPIMKVSSNIDVATGDSGVFTTTDGKVVTVTDGIVTKIV